MKGEIVRGFLVITLVSSLVLLSGCGGSSNGSSGSGSTPGPGQNVQQVVVDGGPVSNQNYPDGAFTSVTICVPGSSNCQTVNGILVDTGSIGLRVLASAVSSLSLPVFSANGATLNNCASFADGSFVWGQVAQADVKIAGEVGSSASIQLIADPTAFAVPSTCSNGGTDEDTQAALGANGILGVSVEPLDCGTACDTAGGIVPPPPVYFACTTTCQTTYVSCGPSCNSAESANQQIENPVVLFATDNNGVVLQFPSVSDSQANVTGSLIFGIGTQSNNAVPSTATVFTLSALQNNFDQFQTNFNGQSLANSLIDSGTNGYFFPDSSIPACTDFTAWYCPTSNGAPTTLNFSAQNIGANGAMNTVNFSIDNFDAVTKANPNNAVFSNIGGPGSAGSFDWGLPFFFGRAVFTSIDGQPLPSSLPAGPWWAY
jgi:hypothetical protein